MKNIKSPLNKNEIKRQTLRDKYKKSYRHYVRERKNYHFGKNSKPEIIFQNKITGEII